MDDEGPLLPRDTVTDPTREERSRATCTNNG